MAEESRSKFFPGGIRGHFTYFSIDVGCCWLFGCFWPFVAYMGNFGGENEALSFENTYFWKDI